MPDMPQTGDPAPPFELPSTEGDVSLAGVLAAGRRLVLAFYFEDATPTCQTELSMLMDAHELLLEFGASVIAVSADSLESHRAFAERLGDPPFPLASDTALETTRAYGVVDDGDPGRARRAIFLIDRDGTVMLSIPHYQPANLAQVEAIFAALGAEG